MHGLVVIEGMTLSGHLWIINEMVLTDDFSRPPLQWYYRIMDKMLFFKK